MSFYGRLKSLLYPAPKLRPAHEPRPPEDWDDHGGWERFYAATHPDQRAAARLGAAIDVLLLFDNDPARFAADLEAEGRSKVWLGVGAGG